MRVLLMISSIAMGGAERNLVSVLPYLTGVDRLTPLICTLNTRRDSPLVEALNQTGIKRFDLDAKRLLDPISWRRLAQLVKEQKIDLISTQDQYTNFFGALARWQTKVPVVMTRHVMQEPTDTLKEAVRAKLVLWAARYGASRLIAVSEAVKQNLAKQAGISLSKIETIYNGIDIERFNTQDRREVKRTELGWSGTDPIIIMVAVLRRGKGHELLLEAIPQLRAAIPNVQIKLVGDGELNESLRQRAAPFGAAVEFLGQRMDVPDLLGASDLLVLPSWSEALPTVLIEAGAASLPVVATDVGGTTEIVVDGETGYIVPPGNSDKLAQRLIEVLQDLTGAKRMGQQAYTRVVRLFSLDQQAQKTTVLFERTLNKQ
jgi:glycosyltransferase involved in cell wall biosynthesis